MPNYYRDRLRANIKVLKAIRKRLTSEIAGRRCLVVGSAPNPDFLPYENDYIMCINGSSYSLREHLHRKPDITFLNKYMFMAEDEYSEKTFNVISNSYLGDVLLNNELYSNALTKLESLNATYDHSFPISTRDRRVVLGEVLGYNLWGTYSHFPRVSNGIFMSALALWCGASEAVLIGFSLNSQHAYSTDSQLRSRLNVREDARYLERVVELNLPISTTSRKLANDFRLSLHDTK